MPDKCTKINIDPQIFEDLSKPEIFINHVKGLTNNETPVAEDLNDEPETKAGLFLLKTANQWINEAKKYPVPKMLLDELWREGELCILFADTNNGKSCLGVQTADSINTGIPIPGFRLEAEQQKVIYFDFELSSKQFEERYSNDFTDHYPFDEKFLRAEINTEIDFPEYYKSFEEYIAVEMERLILSTGTKVLIIDNLTYLKSDTEKAKEALALMKQLKRLKQKLGLSILALAHTPKRDYSKPLTKNDLAGSKMLINFADSAFAIGDSPNDPSIRYIKQIKVRSTAMKYDSQNVMVCQQIKPHNFIMFEFLKYGKEADFTKTHDEVDQNDQRTQIKKLKSQGMSLRKIATEIGVSHMTIQRELKNEDAGKKKVFIPALNVTIDT